MGQTPASKSSYPKPGVSKTMAILRQNKGVCSPPPKVPVLSDCDLELYHPTSTSSNLKATLPEDLSPFQIHLSEEPQNIKKRKGMLELSSATAEFYRWEKRAPERQVALAKVTHQAGKRRDQCFRLPVHRDSSLVLLYIGFCLL